MLTQNQLNMLAYSNVRVLEVIHFADGQVINLDGNYFSRRDHHYLNLSGYDRWVRLYQVQSDYVLFEPDSGRQSHLESAEVIVSEVTEFDGFDHGKEFHLTNGQIWVQTGYLSSPCSPGGKVFIKGGKIRVGNWDFDVDVKRIK